MHRWYGFVLVLLRTPLALTQAAADVGVESCRPSPVKFPS